MPVGPTDDLDDDAFIKAVANLRWAQRMYYSTPSTKGADKQKYLKLSLGLEAQIDRELLNRGFDVTKTK